MGWFKKQKKDLAAVQEKHDNNVYILSMTIAENQFTEEFWLFENYEGECSLDILMKMKEVLDIWANEKTLGYMKKRVEESGINQDVEKLGQTIQQVNPAVAHLRREEKVLRDEILKFTAVVNEVSSRYKLSPTWEGKKPILIEKQKELEKKRVIYEEKEEKMNEALEQFHLTFSEVEVKVKNMARYYISTYSKEEHQNS